MGAIKRTCQEQIGTDGKRKSRKYLLSACLDDDDNDDDITHKKNNNRLSKNSINTESEKQL